MFQKKKVLPKLYLVAKQQTFPLPIPCLLWVPFWLIGIVFAKYIAVPFYINLLLLCCSLVVFFFRSTKIFALGILAFLVGFYFYLNSQYLPAYHLEKLFQTLQVKEKAVNQNYFSNNRLWKAELFRPDNTQEDYIQHVVRGRIHGNAQKTKNGFTYLVELISFSDLIITGKVVLFLEDKQFQDGDLIEGVMKISPNKNTNPGEINYGEIAKNDGIYGRAYAISPLRIIDHKSNFLRLFLLWIKNQINEKIERTFNYSMPLVKTLVLNERQYLEAYNENFLSETLVASGLRHFFTVSGLHVGIIAFVLLSFLRIFGIPIPAVRIITIFLLCFYTYICNMAPPIMRATLFFSLMIIATFFYRKVSRWQIYLFSLFLQTLFHPADLFSLSLQLSYVAYAGIILLLEVSTRVAKFLALYKINNWHRYILKVIINYLLLTLFLSLITMPLLVYHFHIINLNIIFANLVGIIFVSILLPLYLLIIILPAFLPLFSSLVLVAEFGSEILNRIIVILGNLPFSIQTSISFWATVFMFILISLGLFILTYQQKKKQFWLGLACILGSFCFFIQLPETKSFQIIFFDVGHGDLALIRFATDDYLLIDTGEYQNNHKNITQNLINYLQNERVTHIAKVIITHPHSDHYGGLFPLSEKIKIDTLMITKQMLNTEVGRDIKTFPYLQKTFFYVIQDTLSMKYRDYTLHILHPPQDYFHANPNNLSIVAKLQRPDISILFTGDIEKEVEDLLLDQDRSVLKADLLKAPHHGSRTSSSSNFLQAVEPELFIVSSNGNIKRGFPHQLVLDRTKEIPSHVFITGINGAIIIKPQ